MIRNHYVKLFGGDVCLAGILAIFEHLTNIEMTRFAARGESGLPWVQISMAEIEGWMMGLYSRRTIQDKMAYLDELGVLKSSLPGGRTYKSYLLNIASLNAAIQEQKRAPSFVIGKIADHLLIGKNDVEIADQTGKIADQTDCIKSIGVKRDKEIEKETISISYDPPSSAEWNGVEVKVVGTEISEDTAKILVGRFKRLKGVSSFGKAMKDLVAEKTESLSGSMNENELLAAFDQFAEADFWKGWDTAHIVRSFFKGLTEYGPDTFRGLRTSAASPAPVKESPAPVQCPRVDMNFVARWNELVPAKPWNDFGSTVRPRPYDDLQFAARFDDVCRAAAKLIDDGANLTFGYLLRYDNTTSLYQWQNLLNGGLDWMAKGAKKPKGATPDWVKNILDKANKDA